MAHRLAAIAGHMTATPAAMGSAFMRAALSTETARAMCGGMLGMLLAWRLLATAKRPPLRFQPATGKPRDDGVYELDLRRTAALVKGGASDHASEVLVTPSTTFDIDRTIFQSISGVLARTTMKHKLSVDLFWSERAIARINEASQFIPRPPTHNEALLQFMRDDCNLAMEHADGSFMDHLQFCYEYGAAHFKPHSPRVLFLHSLMGVATNYFPMRQEQIPALRALVTPLEWEHLQAFPSILRLLNVHELMTELEGMEASQLRRLRAITYFRVMDNLEVTMAGATFWEHLNYQLIHLLDFLPAASWQGHMGDPLLLLFSRLHAFLQGCGQLQATVDFDLTQAEPLSEGRSLTLGALLAAVANNAPKVVVRTVGAKAIRRLSAQIGHSLQYSLRFD